MISMTNITQCPFVNTNHSSLQSALIYKYLLIYHATAIVTVMLFEQHFYTLKWLMQFN
jgi:hypothetical protein